LFYLYLDELKDSDSDLKMTEEDCERIERYKLGSHLISFVNVAFMKKERAEEILCKTGSLEV
jgi:hypothetical protein